MKDLTDTYHNLNGACVLGTLADDGHDVPGLLYDSLPDAWSYRLMRYKPS